MDLGIGYFFPEFFKTGVDYYKAFHDAHTPQLLSESDKGDVAYRKGVYLSEINDSKFHLLRCSSNLRGPTENFSPIDRMIIDQTNETAKMLFPGFAKLNHVLAQVYHNYRINGRERRAKIARHSDKTKDMPENGLMVFCTFYDVNSKSKIYKTDPDDRYNILYKNSTALTTLRFILKPCVYAADIDTGVTESKYKRQIDILLYPNSAFFMNLETNRLYTHEIVPPNIDSIHIPTRLGYVIRCSKQEAKFEDGQTMIKQPNGAWEKMRRPTPFDILQLKDLYRMENITTERPPYGYINFSLNDGDYLPPVNAKDIPTSTD